MFGSLRRLDRLFHRFDHCKRLVGLGGAPALSRAIRRAERRLPGNVQLPLGEHPFTIRRCTTDLWTFRQVYFADAYKCDLSDARTILDCGAHIGTATTYFARVYPDARILAVEPHPENFELLKVNTAHNPRITPLWGAVYGHDGAVAIDDGRGSLTSASVAATGVRVPCFSMASLLERFGATTVDIVKLDIEGSERSVFDSDTAWLDRTKVLIVELHDRFYPGCSTALYRTLLQHSFRQETRPDNTTVFYLDAGAETGK